MKNVDDLIADAARLAERGLSKGEIADELHVSRETASWLVERTDERQGAEPQDRVQDVHVDWSAIGRDSTRLGHVAGAIADLLGKYGEDVDLTVGIEKAGAPLATMVGHRLDTDLATYAPRKHQWEEGEMGELEGGFSRNFATIRGRPCYVVDDTITTGTTMTETIEAIRAAGGEPVCGAVLVDKRGVDELEGVPIHSLVQVIPVGRDR